MGMGSRVTTSDQPYIMREMKGHSENSIDSHGSGYVARLALEFSVSLLVSPHLFSRTLDASFESPCDSFGTHSETHRMFSSCPRRSIFHGHPFMRDFVKQRASIHGDDATMVPPKNL